MAWPEDGAAVALQLRRQAAGMACDLRAVCAAYTSRLRVAASALPEAGPLAAALDGECANAVSRVRDALREMLFVVLLASLHKEGRLAAPKPGAAAESASGGAGAEGGAAAAGAAGGAAEGGAEAGPAAGQRQSQEGAGPSGDAAAAPAAAPVAAAAAAAAPTPLLPPAASTQP